MTTTTSTTTHHNGSQVSTIPTGSGDSTVVYLPDDYAWAVLSFSTVTGEFMALLAQIGQPFLSGAGPNHTQAAEVGLAGLVCGF